MAERSRLDVTIVARGLAPTRAKARDAILRGCVMVAGRVATAPAAPVAGDAEISVDDPAGRYVSRAALKLIAGLDRFGYAPAGRVVLDIGASTGGFTEVLLERGAAKVHAVDVGHGQLHPRLRGDPRVVNIEGINARDLGPAQIGEPVGAVVADVSFISLRLALPRALAMAAPGAWGVFLVKPQFEVGREHIGKGGIVRDNGRARQAADDIAAWLATDMGWTVDGLAESPITGGDGNREYLLGGADVNETVEIAALGHAGDGIAETDGGRIFVPFTLPGETVTIERSGQRGRLLSIDRASPIRTAPICRHFGACGGCALQHMERDAYLAWKREIVAKTFALSGIDAPVEPVVPIRPGSRRRAVFTAVRATRGVVLGFQRRGSNEVIGIEECPVLVPAIATRLGLLREIAGLAAKPRRPARIAVLAADNGLDIAVTGGGRPDARVLAALGRLGADTTLARLTLDGEEVFVNRRPEVDVGGAVLLPPAGGFVQASAAAEAALAEIAVAHVGEARPVLDLFAGCGTFTLRLARHAPVTAVESEADALAALEEAARRSRGLRPITTRRRDLFHNPMVPEELAAFGAVVFDPPAAGAKAQSEALARSSVAKIVAVSCNPATLARDARILIDGGYRLERVAPVDQFLFSAEIEMAATFSR